MKCYVWGLALALLLVIPAAFAVDGTFSGKVVDPPANEPATPGWVFIQGRNHLLRRVEVAHAEILFSEDVPVSQRHKCNSECLSPGLEVRVTAHQENGEWHARKVEILKVAARVEVTQLRAGLDQEFLSFL